MSDEEKPKKKKIKKNNLIDDEDLRLDEPKGRLEKELEKKELLKIYKKILLILIEDMKI